MKRLRTSTRDGTTTSVFLGDRFAAIGEAEPFSFGEINDLRLVACAAVGAR